MLDVFAHQYALLIDNDDGENAAHTHVATNKQNDRTEQ